MKLPNCFKKGAKAQRNTVMRLEVLKTVDNAAELRSARSNYCTGRMLISNIDSSTELNGRKQHRNARKSRKTFRQRRLIDLGWGMRRMRRGSYPALGG